MQYSEWSIFHLLLLQPEFTVRPEVGGWAKSTDRVNFSIVAPTFIYQGGLSMVEITSP